MLYRWAFGTVEVRGHAQRAEGLGPPKLVKSLEPARTPVTSYQLPVKTEPLRTLLPYCVYEEPKGLEANNFNSQHTEKTNASRTSVGRLVSQSVL